MALFAGILRTEDTARLTELDPVQISDAINQVLAEYQRERNEAQSLLVSDTVTRSSELVQLGGVDEGQEIGPDGRPLETHFGGNFTVGYPMKRIGWALGYNDETFANLTVADLDRQVTAKTAGNALRHRREIMRALVGNANYSFTDNIENSGTVTVARLANSDGTDYDGAGTDDNHYLASGYAAGSISATNNPLATLKDEIAEHQDGSVRVVAFINSTNRVDLIDGLTASFVEAGVEGLTPAAADAQANGVGANVPGTFVGIDQASGVFVYEWNLVPAGYIYAQNVDGPGPLVRRIPAIQSLQGFTVRAEEEHFPFFKRTWIERFGYGVRNRLNGAVMQLTAGSYTVPTV